MCIPVDPLILTALPEMSASPVASISKIPASMFTIEPAFAFASRWKASPAVWAVVILISLATPAASIVIAPEVSMSKAAELISIKPVVVKSNSPDPAPIATPTASKVAAAAESIFIPPDVEPMCIPVDPLILTALPEMSASPVTSMSKIPASMSNIEPACSWASMCIARPATWDEDKINSPSDEFVINEMLSAASTVMLFAESISILPAAFVDRIQIASLPVPADWISTLAFWDPFCLSIRSCPAPSAVTVRVISAPTESISIPSAASISTAPDESIDIFLDEAFMSNSIPPASDINPIERTDVLWSEWSLIVSEAPPFACK